MSYKILIVEDNKDLCEIYQIAFSNQDFEIKISYDGMNAVSLFDQFKPDVILLDIMMPFVSGYDFLKVVREKNKSVLIVINSNLYQEADIAKSKELGADFYI
ncbi:MAG TPA: response regulator, partial [Candidatus Gracilibacteria bacterium]|nr:response regulator [Candidatus Gracilibacteria bacterium]